MHHLCVHLVALPSFDVLTFCQGFCRDTNKFNIYYIIYGSTCDIHVVLPDISLHNLNLYIIDLDNVKLQLILNKYFGFQVCGIYQIFYENIT